MNWTISSRTPSGTLLEAREADAQLACKLAVDIFISKWLHYLFGYVTWPPWQVCLILVNGKTFYVAETVCCDHDSTRCSGSVHISLVSMKQINNYYSNTLDKYYIQIWYIFMHRILFSYLLIFDKFPFWRSVACKMITPLCVFVRQQPVRLGFMNFSSTSGCTTRPTRIQAKQCSLCAPTFTSGVIHRVYL